VCINIDTEWGVGYIGWCRLINVIMEREMGKGLKRAEENVRLQKSAEEVSEIMALELDTLEKLTQVCKMVGCAVPDKKDEESMFFFNNKIANCLFVYSKMRERFR